MAEADKKRLAINVDECAARLGLSRNVVYDLVAQGKIPSVRVGRRIVIPEQGVEAWLAGAVGYSARCADDQPDN